MWIKRTETEMLEHRKRQRRKRLLEAIAGGLLVLLIVTFLFEWRGSSGPFKVPMEELLSRLAWAALAAILSGFVIYRLDRFQAPMMVCPKCEITKHEDGEDKCSCGGRFELMETMKQVNANTAAGSAPGK